MSAMFNLVLCLSYHLKYINEVPNQEVVFSRNFACEIAIDLVLSIQMVFGRKGQILLLTVIIQYTQTVLEPKLLFALHPSGAQSPVF